MIKSLGAGTKVSSEGIADVRLLGYTGKLKWTRNGHGLVIELPNEKPGDYAFGFEIVVSGKLLD